MTPATCPQQMETAPMVDQLVELETICDLKVALRHLDGFLVYLRADVDVIAGGGSPHDPLVGRPDVGLAGSGSGRLGFGRWAVEVYLTAGREGTSITLRALGHDAACRAANGRRSTIFLARSVKTMDILARFLRVMDEEARMQRLGRP
ncbi:MULTISPECIES: hypothetical protein [Micrococcaceae]|uniref:hypothetical protein n=1 Tax=Micrococcaceae TaxID=1268 RepID=UPI00160BAD9A|nr:MULTISPECIES: hypothetical protein [Micrococcaceae]MBB5748605.1 hypothetical protein [Micrococcus sp. TA1]HRO30117.1 hypothetical protein [Citricoccus sp.]HRO93709.1 hypothetical protein [Citricoccus sp.]